MRYAPFHILITHEPVFRENKEGKRQFVYKKPTVRLFQSVEIALREHALAYREGRGGELHIEPPFEDAFSLNDILGTDE